MSRPSSVSGLYERNKQNSGVRGMKQITFVTSRLTQIPLLVLLISITLPSEAADGETSLGGSFVLGSDYTFRGVSQTVGDYSTQASVDIGHSSGLYAYAWGSNVDFVPKGEPDDGARYELDLALGYSAELGDDWRVDIELIRYMFPGTIENVDYDYSEMMATLWFSEKYSATAAFSNDVDGVGAASRFYELGGNFDLPAEMTLQIKYGYYDLKRAYGSTYSYTTATLSRSIG
ncbi:MAG: TorF family putative porin, partial [Woeseiaceae bacterium]